MACAAAPQAGVVTGGSDLPLDGVRVIDLTTTIAGPSATRVMADFGAEVIKIETRRRPDIGRLAPPYAASPDPLDRSGYFANYNAGKRSLSLDLATEGARDVLRRLVERSDVLVEAFRPGTMESLGFAPDTIRRWNPRLVIARHSLLGQIGPHRQLRGFGYLASATMGWIEATGEADGPPVGPFSAYTDFMSAPILLATIIAALEEAEATGRGCVIDHAHADSSAWFSAPEILMAQRGACPRRNGCRDDYASPSDIYPCRGDDAWCAISVVDDAQWPRLVEALDLGAFTPKRRPDLARHANRAAHRDAIDAAISARSRDWDALDLARHLGAVDVPSAPVLRPSEVLADETLWRRGALRRLDHHGHGSHVAIGPAIRLDGVASGPIRPFPSIGADTQAICRDILCMPDAEVDALVRGGVLR